MSIEPTTMTPWIAFDPLMSGVCKMLGTLEMISIPTKMLSIKTVAYCKRVLPIRRSPSLLG
jgi:hypothetical protein